MSFNNCKMYLCAANSVLKSNAFKRDVKFNDYFFLSGKYNLSCHMSFCYMIRIIFSRVISISREIDCLIEILREKMGGKSTF